MAPQDRWRIPVQSDLDGTIAAELLKRGEVVPVALPGDVPATAVTSHRANKAVLSDVTVSKNPDNWRLWADKQIPDDWPLISWVAPKNMFTADGREHLRLRGPVQEAFRPKRVDAMRPRITAIVHDLLDQIGRDAADGRPVDLKQQFALQLPLRVICDLFGVPEPDRDHIQELCDTAFDQGRPVDHAAAFAELRQALANLATAKRRTPGEDVTSVLVNDPSSTLTSDELVDTLVLLVGAGHETTVNLITNAVRALLAHPGQYTLVLARQLCGGSMWPTDLVEETLRWASPIAALPLRYTTVPTQLFGVTIPAGEALLLCYGAANRDPRRYGPDADRFDLTRPSAAHLAFGYGPHYCLGASLARLEARIALEHLLGRFDLT
ncbi:MAG: cytochrome P450, partial [Actinomadura rubrobrunea]|nr:cytochrome P450 [Actinomadura rubrobrunea]